MRRVALIYNPASGQYSARRAFVVRNLLAALRKAGIDGDALETHSPGSARALAQGAIRQGYDTILACGGDGTVHEALQPLVGTDVALGVVPLGTANALAQNLGLSRSPVKALRALLTATPVQVPVGRIYFRESNGAQGWRYFTVAAGVGADALLMSRIDAERKRRFGYMLYLVEGFIVWATHPFPLFDASFKINGNFNPRVEQVSQLLAVRIRSFGGALGQFAPGASLHNRTLSLMAFKTRSRIKYLNFLLAALAGRHTFSGPIELLEADAVDCKSSNGSSAHVYVEADGEVLGALPARIEVASESLTLLVPQNAKP